MVWEWESNQVGVVVVGMEMVVVQKGVVVGSQRQGSHRRGRLLWEIPEVKDRWGME